MKGFFLGLPVIGIAACAYAQGFIFLDNIDNTNTSPTATSSGLFFITEGAGPELITGDFNAVFYGGTDSAHLQLIASFWGASAAGSGGFGPGTFLDPTGRSYPVPGTTATSTSSFFRVQFWTGTATSYYAASGQKGQSFVFSNPVSADPNTIPDLTGMPAVIVCLSCSLPAQLTITRSGENVILTWPLYATGFTLQSTTNLVSPVWTTVSPGPVVIGSENMVINTVTGTQQFYRLSQ
jgi:hypothetical protein